MLLTLIRRIDDPNAEHRVHSLSSLHRHENTILRQTRKQVGQSQFAVGVSKDQDKEAVDNTANAAGQTSFERAKNSQNTSPSLAC